METSPTWRPGRVLSILHLGNVARDGADLLRLLLLSLLQLSGQLIGVLIGFRLGVASQQTGLTTGLGHVRGQLFNVPFAGLATYAGGFMLLRDFSHDLVAGIGKLGMHFFADLAHLHEQINCGCEQRRHGSKQNGNLRT